MSDSLAQQPRALICASKLCCAAVKNPLGLTAMLKLGQHLHTGWALGSPGAVLHVPTALHAQGSCCCAGPTERLCCRWQGAGTMAPPAVLSRSCLQVHKVHEEEWSYIPVGGPPAQAGPGHHRLWRSRQPGAPSHRVRLPPLRPGRSGRPRRVQDRAAALQGCAALPGAADAPAGPSLRMPGRAGPLIMART